MHSLKKQPAPLLCFILGMLFSITASAEQQQDIKQLRFGVAPFMSPVALIKRMDPLRQYLVDQLGVDFKMETSAVAKDFVKRTQEGRYDVIYTSPTFSLLAMEQTQVELVATLEINNAGVFLVNKQSRIVKLQDLAGKRVGAPPAFGFLGQLAISTVKNVGYSDMPQPEMIHFNSHNAAVSALRLGEVDAVMIVEFMEKHLRKKAPFYRVIHRTDDYPGLTVLVSRHIDQSIKDGLQQVLLDMHKNPAGQKVLSQISFPGFRLIDRAELEKVRQFIPSGK